MRPFALSSLLVLIAVGFAQEPATQESPNVKKRKRTVLVIHGGAGVPTPAEMKADGVTRHDYEQTLARSLEAGYRALRKGTNVDAVEAAIRVMEDAGMFDAGRGSVFSSDGRVEMDASIMVGTMLGSGEGRLDPKKRAGAVASVAHVKNPISAARAIMEMDGGRHVLLIADGAEQYVFGDGVRQKYGIERVSNLYFWTDRRLRQIRELHANDAKKRAAVERSAEARFGTVGAVAVDAKGRIAAGTSTGGTTNKMPGRVGDSPILGAGTYADDRACGVSCTGTGELFMRHVVAHDVVARMVYGKRGVDVAAKESIDALPDDSGGLIALDSQGRHAFAITAKTAGMLRGHVTEDGEIWVAIDAGEAERRVVVERDR
jgi:L-asparaginase / beta-aspartyl-peptidase